MTRNLVIVHMKDGTEQEYVNTPVSYSSHSVSFSHKTGPITYTTVIPYSSINYMTIEQELNNGD